MTSAVSERDLTVEAGGQSLPGTLTLPADGTRRIGLVIFVHGSGSSRSSPRNRQVARDLVNAGMATFLFDLLTPYEAADRRNVFDIGLLARRVTDATNRLNDEAVLATLPTGYFGASTGAAAALVAAAELGDAINAVVSRGGRPDLAGDALLKVTAPTLMLVGALDQDVLELNRQAKQHMRSVCDLVIVPGAGHLFEEAGTMEHVSKHAADWFNQHL